MISKPAAFKARPLTVSGLVIAMMAELGAGGASAQGIFRLPRPGDERPELPDFDASTPRPDTLLPPLTLPHDRDTGSAAAGARVRIKRFRFTGNSALTGRELQDIVAPYAGRELSHSDLQDLRDAITRAYIERGYVSSGAVIPAQSVADGELEIRLVEGRLGDIQVSTDGLFRSEYFRERIAARIGAVVNINELERTIQVLQRDRRVRRLSAKLLPTDEPGRSRLVLDVEENPAQHVALRAANDLPPTVGGESGAMRFVHDNVTGRGDSFGLTATNSRGFQELDAGYSVPLNARDTRFGLRLRLNQNRLTEKLLKPLRIEGRFVHVGIELAHPLRQEIDENLDLFGRFEYRQTTTTLLGERFSFAPGQKDGRARVAVARLGVDWIRRSRNQVLAMRGTLSVGLDLLGATINSGDIPDGRFESLLIQAQWARRFPWRNVQLIARVDAQLSGDPLLGLEQFAYGGMSTVRGYRQNERVLDNAVVGSVEARLPLALERFRVGRAQLAAFVDAGNGWNEDRRSLSPHTLVGAGLGLLWDYRDSVAARFYWAQSLRDVDRVGEHDKQDEGVHFDVEVRW